MSKKILALCGGIGGAKLAYGLTKNISSEDLLIVVNTGDDFIHIDLNICPDLDTVTYTLAGINDQERGWGIKEETWNTLKLLRQFGAEDWFQLGDKDLATHIRRTSLLKKGMLLSEVTKFLSESLGVKHLIVPMSETPVGTMLHTDKGTLPFQEYFVKHRCEPKINSIEYLGSEKAQIPLSLEEEIISNNFSGVILCPSNPYLSIDPILSVEPLREYLVNRTIPVIAVSPFINNRSVKGPSAKIALELNEEPSVINVANHYQDILDILVIDHKDKYLQDKIKVKSCVESILMKNDNDKKKLAKSCLELFK
ncbi:MAG: 2-phospho-L-lactate transferase [Gammaproteobacteria bacterium]|nr:2-phospho-L-lactate transferase [Gammaproteobacteria bacterium]